MANNRRNRDLNAILVSNLLIYLSFLINNTLYNTLFYLFFVFNFIIGGYDGIPYVAYQIFLILCKCLQLLAESDSDSSSEDEYKSSSSSSGEENCLRKDHEKVDNFVGTIERMETAVSDPFPNIPGNKGPHTVRVKSCKCVSRTA